MRPHPDITARVAAAADKVRGKGLREPWIRCPLLNDANGCSAYAFRPLSCHAYASDDVQACIKTFVLRDKPSIRCPVSYNEVLDATRTVLVAALKVLDRASDLYELNTALAVALNTEDSETRWRDGENIFAGLVTMRVDPGQEAWVTNFAAELAGTL